MFPKVCDNKRRTMICNFWCVSTSEWIHQLCWGGIRRDPDIKFSFCIECHGCQNWQRCRCRTTKYLCKYQSVRQHFRFRVGTNQNELVNRHRNWGAMPTHLNPANLFRNSLIGMCCHLGPPYPGLVFHIVGITVNLIGLLALLHQGSPGKNPAEESAPSAEHSNFPYVRPCDRPTDPAGDPPITRWNRRAINETRGRNELMIQALIKTNPHTWAPLEPQLSSPLGMKVKHFNHRRNQKHRSIHWERKRKRESNPNQGDLIVPLLRLIH